MRRVRNQPVVTGLPGDRETVYQGGRGEWVIGRGEGRALQLVIYQEDERIFRKQVFQIIKAEK